MRGVGVAAALGAMLLVSACDATDPPGSAPDPRRSTPASAPTSTVDDVPSGADPITRETAPGSTATDSVVAATAPTMPVPLRPFVSDPGVCEPQSAQEVDIDDVLTRLNPYALGTAWHQIQVVADPDLGADGPWAILGTIAAHPRFDAEAWGAESEWLSRDVIADWDVLVTTTPDGFADALIDLGDDVDAYVRTYRFGPEEVRALISGLASRTPRTEGFDVEPGVPGLEIVSDERNGPIEAHIAALVCTVDDQPVRISAITGDPVAQYVLTLDQPYPDIVGRVRDAVVSIDAGRLAPEQAPALDDIVHAPDDVWAELLRASDHGQG